MKITTEKQDIDMEKELMKICELCEKGSVRESLERHLTFEGALITCLSLHTQGTLSVEDKQNILDIIKKVVENTGQ
jgi:hypothetical protein